METVGNSWVMTNLDRIQDEARPIETRAAAAELLVLRTALEIARDEVRRASVSARQAERALRHKQKKCEALKKYKDEYNRITSTLVWKIYSPFDRALCRARLLFRLRARGPFRRRARHLDSKSEGEWTSDLRVSAPVEHRDGHEERVNGNDDGAMGLNSEGKVGVGEGLAATEIPESTAFDEELSIRGSPPSYHVPDLSSLRGLLPRGRIAVVLHLYYPELWSEFRDALGAIPESFDLFVTLTVGYSDQAADWIRVSYPSAQIITLENRGRDILPFITLINSGVLLNYELVCKLHTKRTVGRGDGDMWRRDLVAGVLSDSDFVRRVLAAFDKDPQLGIVVSDGSLRKDPKNWLRHLQRINELSARIGMPVIKNDDLYPGFPAGSIYWIRASLLRSIANLHLADADFEPEPLPRDGCMAHVIERLVGWVCHETGMRIAESGAITGVPSRSIARVQSPDGL
jgi:Rhamnan synthesis protein F